MTLLRLPGTTSRHSSRGIRTQPVPSWANGDNQTMTEQWDGSKIRPGSPRPLGATWDGEGTNFAVYSADATGVDICIYDDGDETPSRVISLPEQTYYIWHGYVPGVGPGTRYGIRSHGPWEPAAGLRFNPNK